MPESAVLDKAQALAQDEWVRKNKSFLPDNICMAGSDDPQSLSTIEERKDMSEAVDTMTQICVNPETETYVQLCGHELARIVRLPGGGEKLFANPALHALPANFQPMPDMLREHWVIEMPGMAPIPIPLERNAILFHFRQPKPVRVLLQSKRLIVSRARVGVVFGNAPTIDDLSPSFFRFLEKPVFATAGVNRCAISKAFERADFAPTLNFIQDSRANFKSAAPEMVEGLRRWAGRTWRICCGAVWPNDQTLFKQQLDQPSVGLLGAGIGCVNHHHSTPLCAIETLYRMGLREFYIYGVELSGSHFAMGPKDDVEGLYGDEIHTQNWWRQTIHDLRDAQFFCASRTSILVKAGIMPYGAL